MLLRNLRILLLLYVGASGQVVLTGEPERIGDELVALRDANGRFCAALQVVSTIPGLEYDSNNGVVQVDRLPGKDLVYLSPDERKVVIYPPGQQPVELYLNRIGIRLKQREVWRIRLEETKKIIDVSIVTEPAAARVLFNSKYLGEGPSYPLEEGRYQLTLNRFGYQEQSEEIAVDAENRHFRFRLLTEEQARDQFWRQQRKWSLISAAVLGGFAWYFKDKSNDRYDDYYTATNTSDADAARSDVTFYENLMQYSIYGMLGSLLWAGISHYRVDDNVSASLSTRYSPRGGQAQLHLRFGLPSMATGK